MDMDAESREARLESEVLISVFLESFPDFQRAWISHLSEWEGESPGCYSDMNCVARFIDSIFFEAGNIEEISLIFALLEDRFHVGSEALRSLIAFGILEDMQTFAHARPQGVKAIEAILPDTLLKVWAYLDKLWAGRKSLTEVLEFEMGVATTRTWADFLNLDK